jgi:cytidyltransferase-like protein
MIAFNQFFTEQTRDGKIVVIFPGRFQPAHKGHASLYNSLKQEFPNSDVYIATSEKVDEKSPFTFEERKFILQKLGIPGDKIVKVKSPYVAKEISEHYDQDKDSLIYALSEKDASRISYTKKDGTPGYFQKLDNVQQLLPMKDKGYVKMATVSPFKVLGKTVTGATQIRDMYKHVSEAERKQIIVDLYGKFDDGIYNLFNKKLK